MEWRSGMLFVYDEPDWERLRQIKLWTKTIILK
jgi:hypothetical protein